MDSSEKQTLLTYLDSPEFTRVSASSTRLVAKLKVSVQKSEFYETHQILRTIYFRFCNYNEKVAALLDLLYHGAVLLLKYQETISGEDIASLVLDVGSKCLLHRTVSNSHEAKKNSICSSLAYHETNNTLDLHICRRVSELATKLPDTEAGQTKFIAEALKILNPKLLNRDLLHNILAKQFWLEKEFASARYHFLHCANVENAQEIASLLVEYQCKSARKSEVDLFIAQYILQLLCLQCPFDSPPVHPDPASRPKQTAKATPPKAFVSRKTRGTIRLIASKIFSAYTLKHPNISQENAPFTSYPLLNFIHFIITLIDSSQYEATTFQLLCDIYKATWNRDPNYKVYLSRIGGIYFGIIDKAKQQQQQNNGSSFFNNILASLLEGDADDEESNHDGNNLSSSDELD